MTEGTRNHKQAEFEVKTFAVPFAAGEIKSNIIINTHTPTNPSKEQIINQAFKLHSEGNISEALKYYKHFIEQGFKDERVFSNYGVILNDLGKLQDSELCTRKAIELNPNFADAHSNLGNILKDSGKLQEAEISYRKAIELKPNFAEAHFNLGNILKDSGKLQEAEISYRKAIELKPNFAESHSNLGKLMLDKAIQLEDRNQYQISLNSFIKAIKINPNNSIALSKIGSILIELKQLKKAEEYLIKAIKSDPYLFEPHINLGILYREQGKLNKSEKSLKEAINYNHNSGESFFQLGITNFLLNDIDAAIINFKTAHQINPQKKLIQVLLRISEKRSKEKVDLSNLNMIIKGEKDQGLVNNPLILKREVENDLLKTIYKISNISHIRGGDPSFGDAQGSNYNLLDNKIDILKLLEKDLIHLLKKNLQRDIFIHTSFSSILGKTGGGLNKHNHITILDKIPSLKLSQQKFSLVYYLSVGDQNCSEPGTLKLYEPEIEILPYKGMIITFPADRYHSIKYNGTKDRATIVVNYYAI